MIALTIDTADTSNTKRNLKPGTCCCGKHATRKKDGCMVCDSCLTLEENYYRANRHPVRYNYQNLGGLEEHSMGYVGMRNEKGRKWVQEVLGHGG